MTEEIWKDITGYEGLYQVSNLGRVKSLGNGETYNSSEHILKPKQEHNGYLRINLWKNGEHKMFSIHRLVANTFISNPDDFPQVNHLDFNKQNNCLENLEFCSAKYNTTYSQGTKIKCLDLETNKIIYYPSIREAARNFNVSSSSIYNSLKRNKSPYKNRFIFTEINK